MRLEEVVIEVLNRVPLRPSDDLESDTIEFKEYGSEAALHNAKDLAEELSALSNWRGGIVIVGVRDGSNVRNADWGSQLLGFDHVDVHTIRERLKGKLKPSVDLVVEEVAYQSRNFLAIQAPHSRSSLVATASGKVCIRDGKSSRPMSPEEIEQAKNLQDYDWSAETLALNPLASLDWEALTEAQEDFAIRRKSAEMSPMDFLEAIGATHNGERMSVNSLRYGRDFPTFAQRGDSIEVTMEARYTRPGVFVIANDGKKTYGITDLLILNSVFEKGYVGVPALRKLLSKVNDNPWDSIITSVESLDCVELCGTKDGLYVRVVPAWNTVLDVQKSFRITAVSKKHVELYQFLFRHGKASNADIKSHLGHKHTSQTSVFLRTAAYTKRSGRGPSAVWSLVE